MGDTISYNPAQLKEISDAFNSFRSLFLGAKETIEQKVVDLETSWEGDDAEIAQAEFTKIKDALANIEQCINSETGTVAGKAEGFSNIRF